MESADLRDGDNPTTWRGFDDSRPGTVVLERLMRTHRVVGAVGTQEPAQVGLAENEEMVAPDGGDHPFSERVLPGCTRRDEDFANPQVGDSLQELFAVHTVPITERVGRSRVIGEGLDDLPGRPDGRRMIRDVEVREFTALMPEDDAHEQQVKGEGRTTKKSIAPTSRA
jgi:hypothetical protein